MSEIIEIIEQLKNFEDKKVVLDYNGTITEGHFVWICDEEVVFRTDKGVMTVLEPSQIDLDSIKILPN